MKQRSTVFLKSVVIFMATAVLAICVFALPQLIIDETAGPYRWVALGLYVPAIPFYVALYQAMKLLKYIDMNNAFSQASVKALQTISYCAVAISSVFIAAAPYLALVVIPWSEDAPGIMPITTVIVGSSMVIAVFASLLKKLLQNAIDIKSENDLTV